MVRFIVRILPAFTTLLMVVIVLLNSFFAREIFLLELTTHFPVQIGLLGALLAVYWIIQKHFIRTVYAVLVCVTCANRVYFDAFNPLGATPEQRNADLRVFHANVLYTRSDYRPIIDTIRHLNPDFFVLQEMTPAGVRAVAGLRRAYPYQDSVWAKGPCYILVGSKTPFTVDSAARRSHRVIALTSTVRGRTMSLITVHPRTPLLPSWFEQRNRQLAFVAQKTAEIEHPAVLIGDFNVSPFSPVFRDIFRGRNLLSPCRERFGYMPTWPRFFPLAFIPIDHALTNVGFQTLAFRTLNTPGSDHRAICVDLVYR